METKTIYIAFDGKEFDDENECFEYECYEKYLKPFANAHFYNSKGQEQPLKDVIMYQANRTFMTYLPTVEAVEAFKEIMKEQNIIGVNNITKPGFYFYEDYNCDEEDYWHRVEDFPNYIANRYDSYTKAKKVKEQLENEN